MLNYVNFDLKISTDVCKCAPDAPSYIYRYVVS